MVVHSQAIFLDARIEIQAVLTSTPDRKAASTGVRIKSTARLLIKRPNHGFAQQKQLMTDKALPTFNKRCEVPGLPTFFFQ